MNTKEHLIAARALIDTPEKLAEVGSVKAACVMAGGLFAGSDAFIAFLSQPGDPNAVPAPPGAGSYVTVSFESILDRFDRAISAQDVTA